MHYTADSASACWLYDGLQMYVDDRLKDIPLRGASAAQICTNKPCIQQHVQPCDKVCFTSVTLNFMCGTQFKLVIVYTAA